jgi:translocation and assembly module TamB
VADLSHFGRLAGLALKGAFDAQIDLEAAPRERAGRAAITAKATGFSTGNAAIDGFAGGVLTLGGVAKKLADGGFGFEGLKLEGAHGAALVNGEASQVKAALHAEINIPEVSAIDPRVVGRAALSADVSGALAHLDAKLLASLTDGRLIGRSTPRLQVSADLQDLTGDAKGDLKLDGLIDTLPATGGLQVARRPDGGVAIDALTLKIGAAQIDGKLALSLDKLAEGHLAIAAPKLDDLSPLVLTKLGGAIDAAVDLSSASGKQDATVRAKSAGLSAAGAEIVGLDVDLKAGDLLGSPSLSGRADLARAIFGGETISGVKLSAKAGADGSDIDLVMRARGLAIHAEGRLAAGAPQFTFLNFVADGAGQRLKLVKAATIAWGGGEVNIDDFPLAIGSGRVNVSGRAGSTLDLKVSAVALPLSAADLAKPGLGLSGTLDASAKIEGAPSALTGDWRVTVAGLAAPQTRNAGLPAISARASGALSGGRTSIDANVDLGKAGALRIAGSAPLSADGALDVRATGRIDLAIANSMLGASGQRASGAAEIDMRLQGAPAKPRALGSITLNGGGFSDEISGFKAENIEATIRANGDEIEIARFHATTPGGGSLGASGNVRLDPDAGFPGALKLTGQRAQLASNEIISTTANLSLDISGPLARSPKIGGRVEITEMDIEIPGRLPTQAVPLAGATHIDPGPTARARLAIAAKAKAQHGSGPAFVAMLDLTVSAPNRIFIRGRGVDAELSGDLKLAGTTKQPTTNGAFQLRRGTFSIFGKTLDFTRGSATFHGDVIPDLDMLAQTSTSDITAMIAITGSAAKPVFTFTSSPQLAQDEILSRILFDKASGSLSPVQALQLANALSSLSGGPDEFERLRKSLGVDSLTIGSDSSGGATVGVRRNLGNRLSVGVTSGTRPEDNGVTMDFDLTKRLRLQGGVDAAGGSTIGAGYQFEY